MTYHCANHIILYPEAEQSIGLLHLGLSLAAARPPAATDQVSLVWLLCCHQHSPRDPAELHWGATPEEEALAHGNLIFNMHLEIIRRKWYVRVGCSSV